MKELLSWLNKRIRLHCLAVLCDNLAVSCGQHWPKRKISSLLVCSKTPVPAPCDTQGRKHVASWKNNDLEQNCSVIQLRLVSSFEFLCFLSLEDGWFGPFGKHRREIWGVTSVAMSANLTGPWLTLEFLVIGSWQWSFWGGKTAHLQVAGDQWNWNPCWQKSRLYLWCYAVAYSTAVLSGEDLSPTKCVCFCSAGKDAQKENKRWKCFLI